jgi:hypothetical protein
VKTYSDKVEVALAGDHTASSHSRSSSVLSVKQRSVVKRAVRSSPLSVGSQVHVSLENFSPGKRIPFDRRSQKLSRALFGVSGNLPESDYGGKGSLHPP